MATIKIVTDMWQVIRSTETIAFSSTLALHPWSHSTGTIHIGES